MRYDMKTLITITFLLLGFEGFSQDLFIYRDSINQFSIGIPQGWQYQISKTTEPGVKLFVSRPKLSDEEKFVENFNVNIVPFPNSNIEAAYIDLKANISQRKGYEFVREGDTTVGGSKLKWHLEKHTNSQTGQPMEALIILGYKGDKGYMVTLATIEDVYPKYQTLFEKIAGSFSL
jgi:hypothetical protein